MLIAIEADNTNIELGVFDDKRLIYCGKISATAKRTSDEFGAMFVELITMKNLAATDIDSAIISCVVPSISSKLKRGVKKALDIDSLSVSAGVKTGLNIKLDDPAVLGSDMVCACVCAKKEYKLPIIIIDLSTATKIYALDKNGAMIGGTISSGVNISIEALSANTSALPHINADNAKSAIGTNTIDAMRSGMLYGTGGMIDGMVERFESEIGSKCTKLITGEFSSIVMPFCKIKAIEDKFVKLRGLNYIYQLNSKTGA